MPSEKQIAANRRNAQKSTGPSSVAGKAAASMNALKTGVHAKSVIIPCEKAADLQQLIEEYYAHYQPATPQARGLVDDLIRSEWTLRRLDTSEASLWNYQNDQSIRPVPDSHRQGKVLSQNAKTLGFIQRRLDATRRGRDRALDQLRELAGHPEPITPPLPEAVPDPVTSRPLVTSSQNGFVPSSTPQTPPRPAPETANSPGSPCEPPHIPYI